MAVNLGGANKRTGAGAALLLASFLLAAPTAWGQTAGNYLAARHADRLEDIGAASRFYEQALVHDPNNEELLRRTFILLTQEGRLEKAVPLALQLHALESGDALPLVVLAVDHLKRDKAALAESFLEALPEGGVAQLVGPPLKAWTAMAASDREGALAALMELDRLQGAEALRNLHVGLVNDLAGEVTAADAAYAALLTESDQLSYRSSMVVANFYQRSGKPEEAKRLYQAQADAQGDDFPVRAALERLQRGEIPAPLIASPVQGLSESLFHLASIFRQQRANDVALMFVQLALYLRPGFDVANVLAGEIHEDQGRPQSAIVAYRRVKEDGPLGWTALLQVADQLAATKKMEEAEWVLKTLAAKRPRRFEALLRLGNLLRAQERFAEAATAYSQAIERIPSPERRHWTIFYFRGIAYEQSDQWEKAEADFLKALELEPGQPNVLNYLAYSWVELRLNLERAEEMLKQAVAARPSDGYIVDSLGWVYYRLGRYEEAARELERAVELRPQDPTINDHLGDAYWQVGRKREARFQWRRALGLEPEEKQRIEIERKLEEGLETPPKDI